MKQLRPIWFSLLLTCTTTHLSATHTVDNEKNTLETYLQQNPNCLSHEIIYEGSTLLLNSDGEYFFGQFNILHPELQMRILMQGITFYIDPTGKKKEKYALHFPPASQVQEAMHNLTPPQPGEKNNTDPDNPRLPDITPLVNALAREGVSFDINHREQEYPKEWATITLDTMTHRLSYTFIVPIETMLAEKKLTDTWSLGLFSEGGHPSNGGPGQNPGMGRPGMGMGMGIGMGAGPDRMMRPRPDNNPLEKRNTKDKSAALRKMMMNDIENWTTFSISEINSLEQNQE